MDIDDIVAALYIERYAPSAWWRTPAPQIEEDNPDICARRRRDLVAAFAEHEAERTEAAA
jgi:hypothetical protein